MTGILEALVGVLGSFTIAMLIAILTGQLVPVSKVTKAETAYDKIKEAYDKQSLLLQEASISAKITNEVMRAVKSIANERSPRVDME